MDILLVAATPLESQQIRSTYAMELPSVGLGTRMVGNHRITLMHTGIGMVNTAFQLGKYLAIQTPDLAINFGIAGSFDRSMPLGTVVELVSDCYAELGAEDAEGFLDLEKLGFPSFTIGGKAYYNTLVNPRPTFFDLPTVRGITVNRVHGRQASINEVISRWNPQVESMESAAFFQVMIQENIRFFVLRGLSNYVEIRNKSNWNIHLAVKEVQKTLMNYLAETIE